MGYTYIYTGTVVADEITFLKVDELNIEVSFRDSGSYTVSLIMNQEVFSSLKQMKVGQKVVVGVNSKDLIAIREI